MSMIGRAAFAIGLAVAAAGCAPAVPDAPTYTRDVQPILAAHCVRCHGANDKLNATEVYGRVQPPSTCYLQRYDDEGDCSALATCKRGAAYCGTIMMIGGRLQSAIVEYVNGSTDTQLRMPPPPSDPLDDWEKDVLARWSADNPAR